MFEKLSDVPAAVVEFYHESARLEPTGNMVEESYIFERPDGTTETGYRLVPEYVEKIYIEQISRGEYKSMEDVWRIVNLHKGSRDDLIHTFLELVNTTDRWTFHDSYMSWLAREPQPDEERFKVFVTEDEQVYSPELYAEALQVWQNEEPEGYTQYDNVQWFLDNAEALRKAAYPTMEEQMRLQFEDMMNGTTKWRDTMQAVNEQYPLPS